MKIKYSRIVVMGVMGIFSVLLFALALAQSVAATTIGTNVTTVDITATGNTILGNATTDTLTVQGATTLTTAAAGTVNVLTGNLKVGDGTPNVTQDGEDAFIEGTLEVLGNTSFGFNGTEQIGISSDLAGTVEGMVRIVGTPSSTSGSTMGILVMQNDGSGSNGLDSGITIDNADTNLALADAIVITSSGNLATGITTGLDFDDTDIVTDIEFQNSETLDNNTDAQFMFGRSDAGTVTISVKDNNADAALTVTPGGAAALTLGTTGAGNTTSITLATDSTGDAEIVLPTDSISTGEILDNTITATDLNATVTFADADLIDLGSILHDDATAQGLRLANCGASPTDITGTNEGYVCWDQTGNRLLINDGTSWGAVVGATTTLADDTADALDIQESTNNYINVNTANAGAVVQFGNATTNPSFSFLGSGSVTTTGSLLARATTDITTASDEALTLTASGTGDVVLSSDADTNIQVTASAAPGVDMIAVTNTGFGYTTNLIDSLAVAIATATSGGATNNSGVHVTILNAPVDASDVINGIEITGVAQTVASTTQQLLYIDPAATDNTAGVLYGISIDSLTANNATESAIVVGTGWDTDLNFADTTPIISIGNGGTIVINDGTATNNLISLADAGAISIGSTNVGTTAISLVTDGTGDGELTVPNESISATEITNVTRSFTLPITSFLRMDSADTALIAYLDTDESGNADEPNLSRSSDVISVVFDVTTRDTEPITTTFRVPQDYASGGDFRFTVAQQAATGANTENIYVTVARQTTGAAEDATYSEMTTTNLTSTTNVQYVTVTPVETYAAGDAINVRIMQGNGASDDVVEIYGVEFVYTATQ